VRNDCEDSFLRILTGPSQQMKQMQRILADSLIRSYLLNPPDPLASQIEMAIMNIAPDSVR
jgi:hypothetical protein